MIITSILILMFAIVIVISNSNKHINNHCSTSRTAREFRDVVFEDVGFERKCSLTLKTEGAGTSRLKLIWVRGFEYIYIYIYIYVSLSLSLSLYIYIYIHISLFIIFSLFSIFVPGGPRLVLRSGGFGTWPP